MARDEFLQMDREMVARLARTGSVSERERIVIENLKRKEAIVAAERDNIIPLRR